MINSRIILRNPTGGNSHRLHGQFVNKCYVYTYKPSGRNQLMETIPVVAEILYKLRTINM